MAGEEASGRRRVRTGALIVPVALLAMTGAAAAAPATPGGTTARHARALCGRSIDPYSMPEGALAACGVRYFPLRRTYGLPDGGTAYVYATDHTTFYMPRPGFDPFLAPAAVRAAYNLPAPPSGRAARRAYWRMARHARFTYPGPFLASVPGGTGRAGAAESPALTVSKTPWGGYNTVAKKNIFHRVSGYYTEPRIAPSPCKNTAEATWLGLGGNTITANLTQAGTAFALPGLRNHQAFFEFPPAGVKPLKLYATPGDRMYVNVTYKGAFTFGFFLQNMHTYKTTSATARGGYNGQSAEGIIEWPSRFKKNLSNFRTVRFEDMLANGRPMNKYTLQKDEIYATKTASLATTSSLAPTAKGAYYSLTATHCAAGKKD